MKEKIRLRYDKARVKPNVVNVNEMVNEMNEMKVTRQICNTK